MKQLDSTKGGTGTFSSAVDSAAVNRNRVASYPERLAFCEEGAAMAGGEDLTIIGPVTPGVVCSATMPDGWADDEILLKRRDDDAVMFVDWLLQGWLTNEYSSAVPFMGVLLARLFVEASVNDFNGEAPSGS
jgi:hypothetical protein